MRGITSVLEYDDAARLEIFTAHPSGQRWRAGQRDPSGGVVLIHGTMVTARVYLRAALRLANLLQAPVHVYNRRGRGGSSPQGAELSLESEARDALKVLSRTGARNVLGHSFGGSVALMVGAIAGASGVDVSRIATFDAALPFDTGLHELWDSTLPEVAAQGHTGKAWAMLVRGLGTASVLSKAPQSHLELLSALTSKTPPGQVMRALVPASVREVQAIVDAPRFTIPSNVFMVTGQFSPAYFRRSAEVASALEPSTRTLVAPGYWHDGPIRGGGWLLRRYAQFFSENLNYS